MFNIWIRFKKVKSECLTSDSLLEKLKKLESRSSRLGFFFYYFFISIYNLFHCDPNIMVYLAINNNFPIVSVQELSNHPQLILKILVNKVDSY